ncbi:aromatic amino acid aminotransferase [Sphingomonas sp. Leaf208]|uniref:aromatic amino acid transaminase n=1 Tax=Sphingomonas sp. Leaf208 TaxID=1735679 RepID=UPI0006FC7A8D|nr:aromatic amino acid transaminase [Sphingomonas sp. Leaf208]KQM54481.1 aromatic amino acid aminotransferase [Sphingomonas sp. Leaf208]
MTLVVNATAAQALFSSLERQPPDALLAVIGMHRADPRADKIDVGVGVYRDELGGTPVMRAVKAAEARLLSHQTSKSYLGAEGDQQYTDLLATVALGASAGDPRITGIQTPGGTGALRLAAELISRIGGTPTVWIGAPTWPNHGPIFREAGLAVRTHDYFDARLGDIDFDAFMAALVDAQGGDVVLLHGCCHNPTGTSFDGGQWRAIADLLIRRGLVPLIDLAYQGLGSGLEQDAAGLHTILSMVPEAMVAYSCDKNFALYRERVGALWVQAQTSAAAVPVRETMLVLARSLWSMPPDHGAATVRLILEDATLAADWRHELGSMCARINALRSALGAAHPALFRISRQQGLFALLPIDRAAVIALRTEHGIYMPESGRINIAGLREATIAPFVAALTPYLPF